MLTATPRPASYLRSDQSAGEHQPEPRRAENEPGQAGATAQLGGNGPNPESRGADAAPALAVPGTPASGDTGAGGYRPNRMREHRHALAKYAGMYTSHYRATTQLHRLLNIASQIVESASQCKRCRGTGCKRVTWTEGGGLEDCPACWGLGFVLRVKSAA